MQHAARPLALFALICLWATHALAAAPPIPAPTQPRDASESAGMRKLGFWLRELFGLKTTRAQVA